MTVAVVCAAGVGSVGGGLTALHVTPSSSAQRSEPAISGSGAAQPAPSAPVAAVSQPHAPDPHAVIVIQMRAVLGRVAEWSRTHAGAPCPDAATLGIAALDPWGHPIELTCTDQPADQIMGAISTGPDGIAGNADDVKSWNLGPSATELVHGSRWPSKPVAGKPGKRHKTSATDRILAIPRTGSPGTSSAPSAEPAAPASAPPAAPKAGAAPSTVPPPIDAGDDIPTRR